MRDRVLYIAGVLAIVVMVYNREAFADGTEQGFYYIPLAGAAAIAAATSLAASVGFLRTRNFKFDAVAVAATEVGLVFLAASIVSGCCLTHGMGGRWWAWDPGLTAALVCWLLYATYLMLRQSVEEPSQRATFAAVWSIFAFLDMPLVAATITWWKPGVHVRTDWNASRLGSLLALVMVGVILTVVRMRQEEARRELDSLRRMTHAI